MRLFSILVLIICSLNALELERITIESSEKISIPQLHNTTLEGHTFFSEYEVLKPFQIAKYELRVKEYIDYLKVTKQEGLLKSILSSDIEQNEPVTNIGFNQAKDTCIFYGGRLPSELEWVVSASIKLAPSKCYEHLKTNTFHTTAIDNFSSTCMLEEDDEFEAELVGSELLDVDMSVENINGTYGMYANVWEWVDSSVKIFRDEYRVIKGGSYANFKTPELFDSRVTNFLNEDAKLQNVGFRCAWDINRDEKSTK
ncbi:SUMF1/EgtB/PvdO family nonheme iron enzyme [Sulfurimonas sp.]|nr:SUMF1/EgtB/PvdO family nonheme iron enzyme [Sulfurimonas sp.]